MGHLKLILSIFVTAAVKVLQGVQAILRKVYEIVNLSYQAELEASAHALRKNTA